MPAPAGVNVEVNVQPDMGGITAPFVQGATMPPVIVKEAAPGVANGLPKVMDTGDVLVKVPLSEFDEPTVTLPWLIPAGAMAVVGVVPVPLSEMKWGPPAPGVLMTRLPMTGPTNVGLKVRPSVQVMAGATLVHVLLLIVNVAVGVIAPNVSALLPVLVMVRTCSAVVPPTSCAGKLMTVVLGLKIGAGAGAIVTVTFWVASGGVPLAACTVKELEPAAVGVPDNTPAPDRVTPAGSVPVAIDHVIGAVPVAVKLKL